MSKAITVLLTNIPQNDLQQHLLLCYGRLPILAISRRLISLHLRQREVVTL